MSKDTKISIGFVLLDANPPSAIGFILQSRNDLIQSYNDESMFALNCPNRFRIKTPIGVFFFCLFSRSNHSDLNLARTQPFNSSHYNGTN